MNLSPIVEIASCNVCESPELINERLTRLHNEEFPSRDEPAINAPLEEVSKYYEYKVKRVREVVAELHKPCVQFFTCEEQISVCVDCLEKLIEEAKRL